MGSRAWFCSVVISATLYCVVAKQHDCPKGWHQVRHACYRAFKTDDLQFKTVFHAQVKCREYGAHLASIPSREIEKEVAEYLHTLKSRPHLIYFGLNDMRKEGHFEWTDGSKANYTNWGRDQPDSPRTRVINENCTTIRSRDRSWEHSKIEWHDFHCCASSGIATVLCEIAFSCLVANLPAVRNARHGKQMTSLVSLGHSVDMECKPGFTFGGVNRSRTAECTLTGWSPDIKEDCREARCIPHPSWRGLIPNVTKVDFIPGDVIEYYCDGNFTFGDGSTLKISKCGWDETWDPPLDDCLDEVAEAQRLETRRHTKPLKEAEGSTAIGAIAIIFISVELGIMVFSDLQAMRLHLVYMVHNVRSRFCGKS
ncbi:hypothetical protein CAPTEDRAFT_190148 [Capitella teleta]|uniref:C-type lectin domain-containing protein n=1 Tax=Capitella teleta TaxID=283909 RepID=R7UL07_CAPTE|nr:hypothetical protein CAPTEDRAFT_190148 [Capitella teleta]|eukprot:ELU07224.1 hypothetical protein CAPTEDRAFT_190148 [Capitella teleta]